jgi:hypothetical protein
MICGRCSAPLLGPEWPYPRINGILYCTRACYEQTMIAKRLTRQQR